MKRINEYKQTDAMIIDVMAKGMTGKVYNLAAGDPNLDVCDSLKETFKTVDLDATHNYGSSQGDINLRKRLWNNPEEVIIANGAKQLIYESLATVTEPGDKVMLIGPCWSSYIQVCNILGIKYDLVVGKEENNYQPEIKDIKDRITPEYSAIVINNPNNPTGVVYKEEYIEALYDIAIENDLWLISDEIYMFITDEIVMTLRGMDNVIVIDGFSKSLNISGWRLGYAISTKEIINAMTALQSQLSGPPSTVVQSILNEAWPSMELSEYKDYKNRIDLLCQIDKFNKHKPSGGFYFYVPISDKWDDSMQLCKHMLEKHHIAMTPGDGYGVARTVRISVSSVTEEDLEDIIEYLKEV